MTAYDGSGTNQISFKEQVKAVAESRGISEADAATMIVSGTFNVSGSSDGNRSSSNENGGGEEGGGGGARKKGSNGGGNQNTQPNQTQPNPPQPTEPEPPVENNPYDNPNRNPSQDKKLTPGDIDKLKQKGWDHRDKGDHGGQTDLYKDRDGNVYQKPKGGKGFGEPIGENLNKLDPIVKAGIITVTLWGLYEGIKWTVAVILAPETGGASLAGAAVLP